jgi:GntR family transcriptional regulator
MAKAIFKHEAVLEHVLELLEGLDVGDALPPERRLAERLDVSRLTLRRAVDELVRQGRLVRVQGSGTFVSEPKLAQSLTMTSFSEDMRSRGMTPRALTVESEELMAGAWLGRRLHLSPADPVLKVRRLRLADEEPMAIETLYVPHELVPGLSGDDLSGRSFYELLEDRYGIVVERGFQTLEPTATSEEESALLGVPLLSPAFLFERTSTSDTGRVVEYVRSVYRGDRYRFTAELVRPVAALGSRHGRAPGGRAPGQERE